MIENGFSAAALLTGYQAQVTFSGIRLGGQVGEGKPYWIPGIYDTDKIFGLYCRMTSGKME